MNWKNWGPLIVLTIGLLLCAVVAFGQTPPPGYDPYSYSYSPTIQRCAWYEFWCSESVYRNPNVSPVIKRKLWEEDPNVCHTDECRRMRRAAGIEYDGITRRPYKPPVLPDVYTEPLYTPVPKPRAPFTPTVDRLVWCEATSLIVMASRCPSEKR